MGRTSIALAVILAGCATPLVHPLRVSDGPFAEVAVMGGAYAGRRGSCDNFNGCADSEGRGAVVSPIQLSGGYGRVVARHVGLMAGAYFPAWENQKLGDWYSPFAAFGFVTAQNDHASAGVGPELGFGGWSVTVGGELQPWGPALWRPRLGAYGRWFWPFDPNDEDQDGRVRTWEVGGRLRVGPIYVQYAYYTQVEGVMYWTIFETASYAQALHLVTIGGTFDGDTWRALDQGR